MAEGHCFRSETDAEVVSHLVESVYDGDLVAAVRAVASELEGHFALLVMHRDHPDLLVGTRRRVPLVAGVGERELVLASSIVAFHELTDTYVPIEDDEIVVLRADASLLLLAPDSREVKRDPERATWEVQSSGLGDFETHRAGLPRTRRPRNLAPGDRGLWDVRQRGSAAG